jgi:hypothetical protein
MHQLNAGQNDRGVPETPEAEHDVGPGLDVTMVLFDQVVEIFRRSKPVKAAKAFFSKAIKHQGPPPETITLDGYAASHRAAREMKVDGLLPVDTKVPSNGRPMSENNAY